MTESWTIRPFSLALPERTDRSIVSNLLRHLAERLDELGPIEVQDTTFCTEVTANGYVYDLTVYFHPLGENEP